MLNEAPFSCHLHDTEALRVKTEGLGDVGNTRLVLATVYKTVAERRRQIQRFFKPLRYVVPHFFGACQNHRSGITQCLAPESKGLNFWFADNPLAIA